MSSPLTEKVQDALSQVLEAFESGKLPQVVAETMIPRRPGEEVPFDRWSLGNKCIAVLSGTNDARTFKAWKRVGRWVKKGSKAFRILAPIVRKVTKKDRETGQIVRDAFGEPVKFPLITGFKTIPVFRVEDTDGNELPARPDYSPEQMPPLHGVAEAWGLEVQWQGAAVRGLYGFYSRFDRQITLFSEDEVTFWHELAHAGHDRAGLLRGGFDKKHTGINEAVAEFTAAVIARYYGKTHEGNAHQYLRQHATDTGGDVYRLVLRVLSDVQKTLGTIFEAAQGLEEGKEEHRLAA